MAPAWNQQKVPAAVWIACMLWNAYLSAAVPLPQSTGVDSSSTNTTNATVDGLTDPFTNPDYLSPSTFTWEQAFYGVLFLLIGGVELIHGYKYIRLTMLAAGYLVWSSTAVMVMIIIDTNNKKYQSSSEYFSVWLAIGLIGAIVSFYLWHVGIVLTGAYGTFVVVATILTAVNLTNYAARYTILGILIVTGGYLTKRYERYAVILATSVGGAYCLMFGLDMFVQTGFRSTFHVMVSQSTSMPNFNAGCWVMIACVPVIAIFGIVWELKHHERPVGGWWFGHGARPLPPLPGEKPPRRCCGCLVARSKKEYKDAKKAARDTSESAAALMATDRLGSDMTLVPPSTKSSSRWACCLPRGAKRDKNGHKAAGESLTGEPTTPTATPPASPSVESPGSPTTVVGKSPTPTPKEEKVVKDTAISSSPSSTTASAPSPAEKIPSGFQPESMSHNGVRRVVIRREEHEFGVEVEEQL